MDSDAKGHTSGHTLGPSEPSAAPLPPLPQYSVNTRSLKTPSPVPSAASAPVESLQAPSSLGGEPAEGGGNVARATISDSGGNQAPPAGVAFTAVPTPHVRPSPQSASSSSSGGQTLTVAVQAVRDPALVNTSAVAVVAAVGVGGSSEEDVRRAYSEMKRAYDDMKVWTWCGA